MPRLSHVDPATATGEAKELLDKVEAALGGTPNMFTTLATSPAALEAYLTFSGALDKGALPAAVRAQIAIAVAEANGSGYCLSAHTALGRTAGLGEAELSACRRAESSDPKTDAALKFALAVVASRGEVSGEEIDSARAAGLADGELAEVVANVAVNVFTNYFNHVAQTTIDFPRVEPAAKAA